MSVIVGALLQRSGSLTFFTLHQWVMQLYIRQSGPQVKYHGL